MKVKGRDVQVSVRLKASIDAELRGALDEPWKELLCIPNENNDRDRHASLTSSTKSSASYRVQRVVDVG